MARVGPYHGLARWLTGWTVGVYFMRYVFTPVDHLAYRLTGGRKGLSPPSLPSLLLTTTGRTSGNSRRAPVLYLADGSRYVVIGSNYGRDRHPAWTANLLAQPRASVRIGEKELGVLARPATAAEFERYWPQFLQLWPGWRKYRQMTTRDFRIFVLEPA